MYRAHSNLPIAAILGFVCVIFLYPYSHAKSITIPGDANSIQEAVDLAVSGDEILLATDFVNWSYPIIAFADSEFETSDGVTITNKDLIFKGNHPSNKTKIISQAYWHLSKTFRTVRIQNSNIEFDNCIIELKPTFEGRMGAPFEIESGSLYLKNCDYTGMIFSKGDLTINNCEINNYAHYNGGGYSFYNKDYPTIRIQNSISARLKIINSTISSDNRSSIKNLHILNSNYPIVHIINSQILGGNDIGRVSEGMLIDRCEKIYASN